MASEIQEALRTPSSKSVKQSASWAVGIFKSWLADDISTAVRKSSTLSSGQDFWRLEDKNLQLLTTELFLSVQKKNGEPYVPDSLKQIAIALARYINEARGEYNLFCCGSFEQCGHFHFSR